MTDFPEELFKELKDKFLNAVVEKAAEDFEWTDTENENHEPITAEQAKENFKKEMREALEDKKLNERRKNGLALIKQHLGEYPNDRLCLKELEKADEIRMNKLKQALGQNFEKAQELLNQDEEINDLVDEINEQLIPGEPDAPKDLEYPPSMATEYNISLDTINTFYQIGLKLFQEGSIEEAISVFSYLAQMDEYNHEIWLALGMSLQKNQEWAPALEAFANAMVMNPADPAPYLYSIDCYIAQHDRQKAEVTMKLVDHFLTDENRAQFAPLIEQYQTLIQQQSF